MQGMRLPTHVWRWLTVVVALAVVLGGVLHLHGAGHGLVVDAGEVVHVRGEGHADARHDGLAQDCADAALSAGVGCCMGAGACSACVPVSRSIDWSALAAAPPRPMAERLAAGPRPVPLYRPPRLSHDV